MATNKTPAPDEQLSGRHSAATYGNNQARPDGKDQFGSALNPGIKHVNDYLAPSDPVRDHLISAGLSKTATGGAPPDQIRDISQSGHAPPDAWGQESNRARQSSAKSPDVARVPDRLGAVSKGTTGRP
jgi:hypothetical protein